MGRALEVISGFVASSTTAPVFTPVTNAAGNTTAIRNYPDSSRADIIQAWILGDTSAVENELRITSPRMHDNVVGITLIGGDQASPTIPGAGAPLMSSYVNELVYAQDVLTVALAEAGATNQQNESLLVYYQNLPGTDARLATWPEIKPRVRHQLGVEVAITTGGTPGEYGGAVAINALDDQFKANQDYAILGYTCDAIGVSVSTLGITSADFGNLRLGGPVSVPAIETRDWFIRLSEDLGEPCIPIFNAANKATTIVDAVDTVAASTFTVTLLLALLTT